MSNFVDCARDQAFLLPPDLRDWIPEDDLAHFVIEAVERVEMAAFKVNHRGTGSAQYHPRMMLALVIYCYANGIVSSRRSSARLAATSACASWQATALPTMTRSRPSGGRLRGGGRELLAGSASARELKLPKVGVVSVDGSKFAAKASQPRAVT